MSNMEKELVFETLKDSTTRRTSIIDQVDEKFKDLDKIRKQSNLSKAAKEYIQEEDAKLLFVMDLIKMAVLRAYNDPELFDKMSSYGQLIKNFDVEIIVRQK